jgi:SAM-dependent methyltransferase
MVNPFEVAFNIGGQKKESIDTIEDGDFVDPSRPLIVDVGCAQGRFLLQLAHQYQAQHRVYNYVGFELRTSLVDAANEAVQAGETKGSVRFLQGDAKSTIHTALAPVLSPNSATGIGKISNKSAPLFHWIMNSPQVFFLSLLSQHRHQQLRRTWSG